MNPFNTSPRRERLLRGGVYVSVLLVGITAGVFLVKVLKPAPMKASLTYEMMFFVSDSPISDFTPRINAMRSLVNSSTGSPNTTLAAQGVGNPQTTQSAVVRKLPLYSVSNSTTVFTRKCQVDVEGRTSHDKVVTQLSCRVGATLTKHTIVSDASEIQVIRIFDRSITPDQMNYYVLLRVSSPTTPIAANGSSANQPIALGPK